MTSAFCGPAQVFATRPLMMRHGAWAWEFNGFNMMSTPKELQIPPWRTPQLWRAANDALARAVQRHSRRLESAIELAVGIAQGIAGLDGAMDDLCAACCNHCPQICCRQATIWYDFKDLIAIHLTGAQLPAAQITRDAGQPCPHLAQSGCTLPRVRRPFVCTWYLCPAHMASVRLTPASGQGDLLTALSRLKNDRNMMETLFIQGITA